MSLVTGKPIHRYQWKVLPISLDVLARVNQLALTEGQPLIATNFKYEWRPGKIVIDEEDELEDEETAIQEEAATRYAQQQTAQPRIYDLDQDGEAQDDNGADTVEENEDMEEPFYNIDGVIPEEVSDILTEESQDMEQNNYDPEALDPTVKMEQDVDHTNVVEQDMAQTNEDINEEIINDENDQTEDNESHDNENQERSQPTLRRSLRQRNIINYAEQMAQQGAIKSKGNTWINNKK